MPLTVAATARTTPSLLATEHCRDDEDNHAAVKQSVRPMLDVGVVSELPRFSPLIVTPQPAVEATLGLSEKLTIGAEDRAGEINA